MIEVPRSTFRDTKVTSLLRTPQDAIEAIAKLESACILEMRWDLSLLWLGDPKNPSDWHVQIWGIIDGPVLTEYFRRKHRGQGTVPCRKSEMMTLITREQVDEFVEAAVAVDARRSLAAGRKKS